MTIYARRTNHLKPEGAYQVLARAQELEASGCDIIHLEIGQPNIDTFSNISLAGDLSRLTMDPMVKLPSCLTFLPPSKKGDFNKKKP
jgi:hypothetical protein